ncbi:hypothetical protein EVAR_81130_1 [Eumeta japonica]|uniref:Uncharacterized protein n=1 Tax=Eumeta variegata TaxID=151549 RepID=A0A4C1YRV8_EUMVA|nr:hypothetical protein EVAR_81130_1 [Eumeta japonica]
MNAKEFGFTKGRSITEDGVELIQQIFDACMGRDATRLVFSLHRVRPDGTCECRRRVTCAMDDAWWKSSRHRMSQETVTGRFPSLLPGRRRLAAAGWSKGA